MLAVYRRPLAAGNFIQALARPVHPGHGQSLWRGFLVCRKEKKGGINKTMRSTKAYSTVFFLKLKL